jgi:hypothetical protein
MEWIDATLRAGDTLLFAPGAGQKLATMNIIEYPDGVKLPAVLYGESFTPAEPGPRVLPADDTPLPATCPDCGVALGEYHLPGCDNEPCPRCGWTLISCGCLDSEEDTE